MPQTPPGAPDQAASPRAKPVIANITQVRLEPPLGPARQFIKVLRVFRILRIFKKVPALRQILVALLRSIPGVMNAFIVMFIFMAIYALIFVDLFRSFGSTGEYSTIQTYGPNDATWGEFGSAYTGEYAGGLRVVDEDGSCGYPPLEDSRGAGGDADKEEESDPAKEDENGSDRHEQGV